MFRLRNEKGLIFAISLVLAGSLALTGAILINRIKRSSAQVVHKTQDTQFLYLAEAALEEARREIRQMILEGKWEEKGEWVEKRKKRPRVGGPHQENSGGNPQESEKFFLREKKEIKLGKGFEEKIGPQPSKPCKTTERYRVELTRWRRKKEAVSRKCDYVIKKDLPMPGYVTVVSKIKNRGKVVKKVESVLEVDRNVLQNPKWPVLGSVRENPSWPPNAAFVKLGGCGVRQKIVGNVWSAGCLYLYAWGRGRQRVNVKGDVLAKGPFEKRGAILNATGKMEERTSRKLLADYLPDWSVESPEPPKVKSADEGMPFLNFPSEEKLNPPPYPVDWEFYKNQYNALPPTQKMSFRQSITIDQGWGDITKAIYCQGDITFKRGRWMRIKQMVLAEGKIIFAGRAEKLNIIFEEKGCLIACREIKDRERSHRGSEINFIDHRQLPHQWPGLLSFSGINFSHKKISCPGPEQGELGQGCDLVAWHECYWIDGKGIFIRAGEVFDGLIQIVGSPYWRGCRERIEIGTPCKGKLRINGIIRAGTTSLPYCRRGRVILRKHRSYDRGIELGRDARIYAGVCFIYGTVGLGERGGTSEIVAYCSVRETDRLKNSDCSQCSYFLSRKHSFFQRVGIIISGHEKIWSNLYAQGGVSISFTGSKGDDLQLHNKICTANIERWSSHLPAPIWLDGHCHVGGSHLQIKPGAYLRAGRLKREKEGIPPPWDVWRRGGWIIMQGVVEIGNTGGRKAKLEASGNPTEIIFTGGGNTRKKVKATIAIKGTGKICADIYVRSGDVVFLSGAKGQFVLGHGPDYPNHPTTITSPSGYLPNSGDFYPPSVILENFRSNAKGAILENVEINVFGSFAGFNLTGTLQGVIRTGGGFFKPGCRFKYRPPWGGVRCGNLRRGIVLRGNCWVKGASLHATRGNILFQCKGNMQINADQVRAGKDESWGGFDQGGYIIFDKYERYPRGNITQICGNFQCNHDVYLNQLKEKGYIGCEDQHAYFKARNVYIFMKNPRRTPKFNGWVGIWAKKAVMVGRCFGPAENYRFHGCIVAHRDRLYFLNSSITYDHGIATRLLGENPPTSINLAGVRLKLLSQRILD